jgi:hypothetical protein
VAQASEGKALLDTTSDADLADNESTNGHGPETWDLRNVRCWWAGAGNSSPIQVRRKVSSSHSQTPGSFGRAKKGQTQPRFFQGALW